MNIYGYRYATLGVFTGYCRDLNIKTDERELERYEAIGAMFPSARVVYPNEYVIENYHHQRDGNRDWDCFAKWPELSRLTGRQRVFPHGYEDLSDQERVHCFDREFEAGDNPYLHRPDGANFQPWSSYRVTVCGRHGNEFMRRTADHYYSYWQVHQLHFIQKYPDLFKNAWLIEHLREDAPMRGIFPRSPTKERLSGFEGMGRYFDALSFWVTVYMQERNRTFAGITEENGARRLDDAQEEAYQKSLSQLAKSIRQRFQLTAEDLYVFLRRVIKLYQDYERDEQYKLAEALKQDIFSLEDLIELTTGDTRDQIAGQLGQTSFSDKQTFRRLNPATKERDYAADILKNVASRCHAALQRHGARNWSITDMDINGLLDHCEQEGLGLLPSALGGMVAVGNEEYRRNFRRVQRYTNLKNIFNSYEYFLKDLAVKGGLNPGRKTLTPLVETVMCQEGWYSLFKSSEAVSANSTTEFLNNLDTLLKDANLMDSEDGYWARNFLVTCLARNMTVHSYPMEDSYYGDLFGPMLEAAIVSTFYTWKFAQKNGWI